MNNILNITMIIMLGLLFIYLYSYSHEVTHVAIYTGYNCKDINMNLFHTTATCPNDNADLPTAINEIVGYTISPLLFVILFYFISKDVMNMRTQ